MAKRKCRWALWSVGAITNRVSVEMSQATDYIISAVVSSNKAKAQEHIKKFGFKKAKAYDNIDDVLSRDDIDIVYIASPPWLHLEHATKVMNAGKAVLVEKPMANDPSEVKAMFECAKKNNVFCVEGVWSNYFPAMKKAKEWIEAGEIGEVIEVITTFGGRIDQLGVDPTKPETHWGCRLSTGGGALMQFGPYNVNISQFVFGKAPEKIIGSTDRLKIEDGADMTTTLLMYYNKGKAHTFMSAGWRAKTMPETRISGTNGEILIGDVFFCPNNAVLKVNTGQHPWLTFEKERFDDEYLNGNWAEGRFYEGFKYQFDAVSKYVVDGLKESPDCPAQYSIDLAETLEKIRKKLKMQ